VAQDRLPSEVLSLSVRHRLLLTRCRRRLQGARRHTVPSMDTGRGRSFGSIARTYDRARASYPTEALGWVLEHIETGAGTRVLDLGAGTGRLSAVLLGMGVDVVAVEPDDAMRALVPAGAQALAGTAEQIPLPDRSVNAVMVGQAWHWFDHEQALAQVRRVLRPGGVLGLLWNVFDDRVPWVAELVAAASAEDRLSAMDDELPYEGDPVPERREFAHSQAMTRDLLVDNLASRSRTVLMPPAAREDLLRRVREVAPADAFELHWICDTWRARVPGFADLQS